MINPIDKGGLKDIHAECFANALKTAWVKLLLDKSNTGYWKIFFNAILSPFEKELLFYCNYSKGDVHNIKNTFIKEVCMAWA